MSHISKYKVKISNIAALKTACAELGIIFKGGHQIVRQFGNNEIKAIASVKLPGWRYDIAIDKDGNLLYDHFGSGAKTFSHLGLLCQKYNQVAIEEECWIAGNQVTAEYTEDGQTILIIEVQ